MRVLLVSDLHGNAAALDAVLADAPGPFDAVLNLGDIVDYGPDPVCCLNWAMRHVTHGVRGNHDHGVAQGVEIVGESGFRYLTMATRKHTRAAITPDHRHYLARLPTTRLLRVGDLRVMLVHASPRDPLDEYVPPNADAWAEQIAGLRLDILCVGHTHIPCQVQVGSTTVVNPGSVGLPRDGNPNARYAVIEDGTVTMHEVPYDVERTVAAVQRAPLDALAREMLADVYRRGRYVHPPGLPVPTRLPGFAARPA
jgi:putative phosphoesterase